jgi:hypothetical protein
MGAQDTDEEIASMMGILPVVIKASEILNVDAEMRPVWREFLANLAPLPRSDHPSALPTTATNREPVWIRGLPPVVMARGNLSGRPDGNTMPAWFFDLCTLESPPERLEIGRATFNTYAPPGAMSGRRTGVLSKVPLVAAIMGRADAVQQLVPAQFHAAEVPVLANRLDLREGAQTTSAQRLGNASDALHTALCYDLPPGPAELPVLRVFAAWPTDWDASFSLLARGGFMVSSMMKSGQVPFVELQSRLGGECRLRNPWGEGEVTLHRDGRPAETLSGSLLRFNTRQGEVVVVVRPGTNPESLRHAVP